MQIFYAVTYQVSTLFFLLFTFGYYFRGKNFKHEKKLFINKIIIITLVGVLLFCMYLFEISNYLLILIIVFPLSVLFLDITVIMFFYFFIFIGNIFFYQYSDILFIYLSLIILSILILKHIKDLKTQFLNVFFLSLLSMNLELIYCKAPINSFIIFNIISIVAWSITILLSLYFYNKNKIYNEYKMNACLDKETNVKNYYCLINNSAKWLKDKYENVTFLLINIDRLKDINRLYGKDFGNKVINIVADSMKKNVKGYGEIYRLDGDTFCIMAVKEKLLLMQAISEKIRLDIDKIELIIDNNKINITVSIGAYHGKINSKIIDDYIELAQDSLIISKTLGRNKVVFNKQLV